MATIEVNAVSRTVQGRGASRRLRRSGKVPAIVYGAGQPAHVVELDHKATFLQLRQEAFHASILSINIDGNKENVLLRDVQMHPWKQEVLHIDFQRVDAKQKIHMRVPFHFINEDTSPGVKFGGGVINHVMTEVEISCLPAALPEYIEVDLGEVQIGHSVHLSEVKFPSGVESVQLVRGDDSVVATVQVPRAVVEPEAVEAVAGEAVVEAAPQPQAEESK